MAGRKRDRNKRPVRGIIHSARSGPLAGVSSWCRRRHSIRAPIPCRGVPRSGDGHLLCQGPVPSRGYRSPGLGRAPHIRGTQLLTGMKRSGSAIDLPEPGPPSGLSFIWSLRVVEPLQAHNPTTTKAHQPSAWKFFFCSKIGKARNRCLSATYGVPTDGCRCR